MTMKLLKAWLRIKLRQVSTTGGVAIGLIWLAKQLGYEIPPEFMPSLENIGMALASILLIFMKESGETDALKDAKHQLEIIAHEPPVAPPAAASVQPESQPGSVRSGSAMPPYTGTGTTRDSDSDNPGGGFNG